VYPSGQCEENARDQGHTQLGLGYFAKAARVAWSQGVDLWGAADNRLALGFEYTAKYMLGADPPAYGVISPQGRGRFSDIYELVYQHYHFIRGLELPYTARAIDRTRPTGWTALTMYRGALPSSPRTLNRSITPAPQDPHAGALVEATSRPPSDAVMVMPGHSIQEALDGRAASGGWVVLGKGLHTISAALRVPSGITLAGQGRETILFLDPKAPSENVAFAILNAADDLHDVTLRDFILEGSTLSRPPTDPNQDHRVRSYQNAPSRGGILFEGQHAGQMRNLRFEHLTVRNCSHHGVSIRGASQVAIVASDFSDNGGSVVPGQGLEHDLQLTRVIGAEVRDSRFDDSSWGSGIDVTFSRDVTISNNEAARNTLYGVRVGDSENVTIRGNMLEGNDAGGTRFDRLFDGSRNLVERDNVSRNNGGPSIAPAQPKSPGPQRLSTAPRASSPE
jgi:parallel beta-helix repeat protein